MRHLLLAGDHALADAIAQFAQLDHLDVRAARHLAIGRRRRDDRRRSRFGRFGLRRRSRWRWRCGRFPDREVLDVFLHDAPAGAGPLDLAQIDALLVGNASRDRAGLHAPGHILLGRRRRGRGVGFLRGSLRLFFDCFGLFLGGFCFRFGGGRGATFRGGFAFLPHIADRRADGHHVTSFGQQLEHRAARLRLDLDGGLVSLDLGDHVAFVDRIAHRDLPGDQGAFGHIEAQLGHGELFGHHTTSLTAATIFCASGSAINSISRE